MATARKVFLTISILTLSTVLQAGGVEGWVKANMLLAQLETVMAKYKDVQDMLNAGTIKLEVAEPRADAKGAFVVPFNKDGAITAWAEKALNAQAAAMVGEKAGDKAMETVASKIPFGGLAAGFMKGKTKELAAVTAVGGWDFIRSSSDTSFDKQEDFSVYLHSKYSGGADYEKALAAAMAIYPDLEKKHEQAIDNAYKKAQKAAK